MTLSKIPFDLKSKVSGIVVLLLLAGVWLVTYVMTAHLQSEFVSVLSHQQFSYVSHTAAEIEQKIQKRFDVLEIVGKEITPAMLANPQELNALLIRRPLLVTYFGAGVVVISKEGTGLADYPIVPERMGGNFNDIEYFRGPMDTGRPALGKPRMGRYTKALGVAFGVPIRGKGGQSIGVLAGFALLGDPDLFGNIQNTKIGKTGWIAVSDARYRIVAAINDPKRILQPFPPLGTNKMLDQFAAGYEGSGISINSQGREVLSSGKQIGNTGWFVQIVLPTAEAFEPVRELKTDAYKLAGILGLLAALVVWVGIRKMLHPLATASADIRSMTIGDHELRELPVICQDEIGELLGSFNMLFKQRHAMEEEINAILDNSTVGITFVKDRKQIWANKRMAELFGYSLAEMACQETSMFFITNEAYENLGQLAYPVLATGEQFSTELEMAHRDGGHIWMRISGKAVTASDLSAGSIWVFEDIRTQKQSELRLLESLAFNQTVLADSPVPMGVYHYDGACIAVNQAYADLVGATQEQLLGQNFHTIKIWEESGLLEDSITAVSEGGKRQREIHVVSSFGKEIWCETVIMPTVLHGEDHLLFQFFDRTVQKRNEEALVESEERFRTIADHTYDWEYWEGAQRELLFMSPSCERITGYSPAEFMANPELLYDVIHPEDRHLMDEHRENIESRHEDNFDFRIVRRDGRECWIAHGCQAVYGSGGQYLGRRASNRDITDRKQIEHELRENECRFNELFENMSSGVAVYRASPDGQDFFFVAINRSCERIENIRREELIGKNLIDVFPGAKDFGFINLLQRVQSSGVAEHCPATYYSDGKVAGWRENYIYKLPSGEIVAIYDDVTTRKQAEAALIESEERFRGAFNTSAHGMALVSIDGRFIKVNPSLCRMLGYENAELLATNFQTITHTDDLATDLGYVHQLLEGAIESYQMEKRYIHKQGNIIWILLSVSLVRAIDGTPVHFVSQIQDITDRKQAEEQVQRLVYFDTLTNLPNRRMLSDRLNLALVQARRFERSLAVMFLDLDNFKTINDTLGHDAGDELLKEVAVRLTSCVRSGDTVARQGGDEFIIVLPEIAEPEDASLVAQKILTSLGVPMRISNHDIQVTISIGIAVYPVNGDDGANELMKKADKAMYAAKEAGRNGFQFFFAG